MKINKVGKILIGIGIIGFLGVGSYGLYYTSKADSNVSKITTNVSKIATVTKASTSTNSSNTKNTNTDTNTKPTLQITKIETKNTYESSSNYADVNITVHNNGDKDINYVKINLYFKDKNGNIVKSDWTNDDSCIKPNASQIITDTVKSEGWDRVRAEIAEYN